MTIEVVIFTLLLPLCTCDGGPNFPTRTRILVVFRVVAASSRIPVSVRMTYEVISIRTSSHPLAVVDNLFRTENPSLEGMLNNSSGNAVVLVDPHRRLRQ